MKNAVIITYRLKYCELNAKYLMHFVNSSIISIKQNKTNKFYLEI